MAFSDAQLAAIKDRNAVLKLSKSDRLRWFNLLLIIHRESERIASELTHLLNPNNPIKIILLIGMTGIGKTRMLLSILQAILKDRWQDVEPSDVPYIFVKTPANGGRSFSWRALWREVLRVGHDVLIENKIDVRTTPTEGDQKGLVYILRAAVVSLLTFRRVRVLIFDEVAHIFRHEAEGSVMDTIKSLADATPAKLVLAGAFDVVPMVAQYGQIQRRLAVLHYRRYRIGCSEDEAEFKECVKKFQEAWPCAEVPDFAALSDRLMFSCVGSVGLLKEFMSSFLQQQLKSKGEKINVKFLRQAALSKMQVSSIEAETTSGEATIRDFVYGDSDFCDGITLRKIQEAALRQSQMISIRMSSHRSPLPFCIQLRYSVMARQSNHFQVTSSVLQRPTTRRFGSLPTSCLAQRFRKSAPLLRNGPPGGRRTDC